jgi:hypothetical protein
MDQGTSPGAGETELEKNLRSEFTMRPATLQTLSEAQQLRDRLPDSTSAFSVPRSSELNGNEPGTSRGLSEPRKDTEHSRQSEEPIIRLVFKHGGSKSQYVMERASSVKTKAVWKDLQDNVFDSLKKNGPLVELTKDNINVGSLEKLEFHIPVQHGSQKRMKKSDAFQVRGAKVQLVTRVGTIEWARVDLNIRDPLDVFTKNDHLVESVKMSGHSVFSIRDFSSEELQLSLSDLVLKVGEAYVVQISTTEEENPKNMRLGRWEVRHSKLFQVKSGI